MNKCFKQHLIELSRTRTSLGRDMVNGLCLDRNERVSPFEQKVLSEIQNQVTSSLLSCYPDPFSLYKKLSSWLGIQENQLYINNGSTESIRILYETCTNPGDELAIMEPTYPMYKIYGKIYQTNNVELKFEKDLSFNLQKLKNAVTEKTVFCAIANPNLPIETYVPLEMIEDLASYCRDKGVLFVVDEAYGFFKGESARHLVDRYKNLVVLMSFSKALGLAGTRLGYMVSCAENIQYFSKTLSLVESNGLSMMVAEYMMDHPKVIEDYISEVDEGRVYIQKALTNLGLKWYGGNYTNAILVFFETRKEVDSIVNELKSRKIYVRASFEAEIENCIRITLGPKEIMEKFMVEFKKILKL